jgi:hypothetical protein
MTTLTLRYIKGDFVVTGSDIEPLRFKTRRAPRDGGRHPAPEPAVKPFERCRSQTLRIR